MGPSGRLGHRCFWAISGAICVLYVSSTGLDACNKACMAQKWYTFLTVGTDRA